MKSTKVPIQAGRGSAGRAKSKKVQAEPAAEPVPLRAAAKSDPLVVPAAEASVKAAKRIVEGASLQNGQIRLVSKTLPVGTSLSVYVNGHLIGSAVMQALTMGGDVASIVELDVKTLPPVEYPFEFRFADNATGREAHPSLLIKDVQHLVAGIGDAPANVKLTALYEKHIDFDFEVAFAPDTGRRLAVKINGRVVSEGLSVATGVNGAGLGTHVISLDMAEPLRDGFLVELVDALTGRVIFRRIPTWTDLVGALTQGQKELCSRLSTIERDIQKLSVSIHAVSGQARERLLLDRLDMFYALIQERLDKELRVLNPPSRAFQTVQVPADREIDAGTIEGTGFYSLEGSGSVRWRWFGPNVNFVIRDVSAKARELHFTFFSVNASCQEANIIIRANGYLLAARARRDGDRVEVVAPIDPAVFGSSPMKSLIVEVGFPYHFQPEGDIRLLSAAFSGVSVRH